MAAQQQQDGVRRVRQKLTCRKSSRGRTGMVIGCKGYNGSQRNSCTNVITATEKLLA